jgi:PAT family beta-lactamase induction signal transducer AmpG
MTGDRPLPAVWLMGAGYLPLGVFGMVSLVTVPQLMAANHVPEVKIASLTAVVLIPGFINFLFGPLLDWRFSRRAYAIGFAVLGGVCLAGALLMIANLAVAMTLLFTGFIAVNLTTAAVGGWFGNLARDEDKASLGAWFTVANIGGGGLVGMVAIPLLRGLPYPLGCAILGFGVMAAIPLFLRVPCPPADGRLGSESFRAFARDVLTLLSRPTVLWTLLLFLAPSAAFALTNTLGGLGHEFGASEAMVGFLASGGSVVAGVIASLLMPQFAQRVPLRPLYLIIGAGGAAFTAALIFLPHTPLTFGLAFMGEIAGQAAAFTVQNAIMLRTIGHNNPLAATQCALLGAGMCFPLAYMQALDAQGYGLLGGIGGAYLTDAAISGAACAILALVLWLFRRRVPAI